MATPRIQRQFIFPPQRMTKQLYIRETKRKGRGVFCNQDLAPGDLIEVSPLILLPPTEAAVIEKTVLGHYGFYFNREENSFAIAMGFGSMYNYAQFPNAMYELDREQQTITYAAYSAIPAHTEITINYSGEYGRDFSTWFTERKITVF